MKIAHLSDSHLGYSQYNLTERRADFFSAFRQAVERMVEEQVDIVVHSGDLFESSQPDINSLSVVINCLKLLKDRGIPFIAIMGNHDRVLRKGKMPPHKILEELGLLTFIGGGKPFGSVVVKDVFVAGVHFMPRLYMEQILNEKLLERFSEQATSFSGSVFLFHQGVDIYLPFENAFELSLSDLPPGFSYYAGGHIHIFAKERVFEGLFSYAGATEFRSVKEAVLDNRGFNIFNLSDGSLTRIKLENLREFMIFDISEGEEDAVLKEIYDKVVERDQPPVVTIRYSYVDKPFSFDREMFKKIQEKALIVRVIQKEVAERKELGGVTETVSLEKVVDDYFKGQKKVVRELAKELASSPSEQIRDILSNFIKENTGLEIDF
ncbi:metallophosphoesterase family protein [Desulfurobacterium atlanticum]|uniref:DNA repair exonuclease SbcCD nuclease subunit n=1 Tax=Desulfurobacterium atlanticum TaxID=240169 RepID=A0A238XSG4_9BACT|nr:exonuclease SbcCD subunit D [Desulfurobacterium atlanticum]SNR61264.1 DNA repair exonuclease SbcCD nuclease subunit [Desulfurobacterium atlanticum]